MTQNCELHQYQYILISNIMFNLKKIDLWFNTLKFYLPEFGIVIMSTPLPYSSAYQSLLFVSLLYFLASEPDGWYLMHQPLPGHFHFLTTNFLWNLPLFWRAPYSSSFIPTNSNRFIICNTVFYPCWNLIWANCVCCPWSMQAEHSGHY